MSHIWVKEILWDGSQTIEEINQNFTSSKANPNLFPYKATKNSDGSLSVEECFTGGKVRNIALGNSFGFVPGLLGILSIENDSSKITPFVVSDSE